MVQLLCFMSILYMSLTLKLFAFRGLNLSNALLLLKILLPDRSLDDPIPTDKTVAFTSGSGLLVKVLGEPGGMGTARAVGAAGLAGAGSDNA
jgi:hypothetical protein